MKVNDYSTEDLTLAEKILNMAKDQQIVRISTVQRKLRTGFCETLRALQYLADNGQMIHTGYNWKIKK